TPRQRGAITGVAFFGYFFWRCKNCVPAAGTDSRLVSTAVQPHCVTRRGTGSTVVVVVDVFFAKTTSTAASQ
ncbi:MAG: hypothetical protein ACJ8G3_13395, partial [Burkholderiaceae bacterium]